MPLLEDPTSEAKDDNKPEPADPPHRDYPQDDDSEFEDIVWDGPGVQRIVMGLSSSALKEPTHEEKLVTKYRDAKGKQRNL